ncbi:DUF6233 domain-containing protein, partial [Streptomyces sp. NPDC059153]|uniref:DUF6233 domain-containing protein n=1 Tax=Streptomyces sp. NPDC059153 TaxID=3346743 RepID=UPI0036B706F5
MRARQRARAEQSWKIQPRRSGEMALLHHGGCSMYKSEPGYINHEEAIIALAEPDIEPCQICTPQTGAGAGVGLTDRPARSGGAGLAGSVLWSSRSKWRWPRASRPCPRGPAGGTSPNLTVPRTLRMCLRKPAKQVGGYVCLGGRGWINGRPRAPPPGRGKNTARCKKKKTPPHRGG